MTFWHWCCRMRISRNGFWTSWCALSIIRRWRVWLVSLSISSFPVDSLSRCCRSCTERPTTMDTLFRRLEEMVCTVDLWYHNMIFSYWNYPFFALQELTTSMKALQWLSPRRGTTMSLLQLWISAPCILQSWWRIISAIRLYFEKISSRNLV